jgi:hypothetical protein
MELASLVSWWASLIGPKLEGRKGFGEQKRKRVGWAGVGLEQLGRTEES